MTTYDRLVCSAIRSFKKNQYERSRTLLEVAADYQYNLNIIFADNRLEDLLHKMSEILQVDTDYIPIKGNVIFYDCFAWDCRGLTQQYIDALCHSGKYKVLFVHETSIDYKSVEILKMLSDNHIDIIELGNVSWQEKAERLAYVVRNFKAEKVLCHLLPHSSLPIIVFSKFHNLIKYQINLTDHAFWLGCSCFDYSFEFRNYGATLSHLKRNISREKLLLLPYYPWQDKSSFEGFPIDTTNRIVILTAGSFYKLEDPFDTYFNIVKRILIDNENTVLMLAGDGNRQHLEQLIKKNNLSERFFLLGNRKDINQVFLHSDIYLSTYPFGGGLVSQFAARNGLPILMYKCKDIEQIVCTKKSSHFSFDTIDDLVNEATSLINDAQYRSKRGSFFKSLSFSQNDFRDLFISLFDNSESNVTIVDDNKYQFDLFYTQYLDRINCGKLGLKLEKMIFNISHSALCFRMWINFLPYVVNIATDKFKRFFKICF